MVAKDSLFGTARQTLRARSTCTATRGARRTLPAPLNTPPQTPP